ncbi:MAG: hypothetical protein K1X61_07375 [Chitinophagales bacterium]|nr:hypothetical protein [Chitinophagales bacterium]
MGKTFLTTSPAKMSIVYSDQAIQKGKSFTQTGKWSSNRSTGPFRIKI